MPCSIEPKPTSPKSSDPALAIRCAAVTKRFHFYEHRTTSLREAFIRVARRKPLDIRRARFTLHDVSFDIAPGEALGIIGPNGSGKSTLLRLLAGIYAPTEGRIEVRGRTAAVIELGAGFHPELTGAENVDLYGAVMGLSPRELAERFDEIVAFAGLAEFIDTPIKYYSSGMQARLAFAVTVCVRPDILLIDEALAVGDQWFRERCLAHLTQFHGAGGTLVIVSHDMDTLSRLCGRAVWLERGSVRMAGPMADVRRAYEVSSP